MKQLALFLLFFSSYTFAQSNVSAYTAKIDSVQKLLMTQPSEDTTKVVRLNDLALLCLFDMQFQRGIIAAKQARQISQKLNYPKGKGLYLTFMRLLISGDSYLSNYYYLKTTLLYADIKEKEEPNQIFNLFQQKREPEKVIAKYLEAVKYFEKNNDKEMMAHILCAISANYQKLNKTNESVQYTDQAIKLFKETGQPELAFMVSLQKITQLHLNKKINEANEVEKEAKFIIANIKNVREKALLNFCLGLMYMNNIQNKKALGFEYLLKADYELEKIGEKDLRLSVVEFLGFDFDHVGMYQESVDYFNKAIEFRIEANKLDALPYLYIETLFELVPLKKFDEAKQYLEKARSFANEITDKQERTLFEAKIHDGSGQLLMGQGKYKEALEEYFQANKIADDLNNMILPMYFNSYIAQCYQKLGDWEKSILFGEKSYKQILITANSEQWLKIKTSLLLSEVYEETGQSKKAFEYLKKYRSFIQEKEEQDIANLSTNLAIENFTQKNEQEKAAFEKEKLIKEHENKNQRWWIFSIAAALLSSFVFLYFLYRNNQNKQKANNLLSRQKEEINLQRDKAEKALTQLKATQAQLIQSEKLASLGELTAGIAHEIQNPLNFVNNFSELSVELAQELKEEVEKLKILEKDKEYVTEIIGDLSQNQAKINQHGKRASSIVSGMLEHSKASTGERALTDINKLADEYLRLSYHGLRAKDSNFNSDYKTDFDENLPKIEVIPQDMGRVLLNLINNAFWATNQRNLQGFKNLTGLNDYNPTVTISTQQAAGRYAAAGEPHNQIIIKVTDNGTGMSEDIKAKIFQPFFTTKPTGQGTGLGLSLAYDIVTKGHGGTIEVESKQGQGSEFIITLPMTTN